MKMDFSKDELAMVYQYAAGTKEETLAGLKEIVPVIRDFPGIPFHYPIINLTFKDQ